MNFSKNSKNFFRSRNIKNIINSKFSGNMINSFFNKMRIKSYLNFSNNFFAFKILSLRNNLISNIAELKQITSVQEKLNSEINIETQNLNNLLVTYDSPPTMPQ